MSNRKKSPEQLRSARWFAPDDLRSFIHRWRAMQMEYAPRLLDKRHYSRDRAGTTSRPGYGLEDFETASRKVPVIANVRPSGDTYLMEDFFYPSGLPALMNRIKEHFHLDCVTVTGKTLGDHIAGAKVHNDDVIRTVDNPIYKEGRSPCSRVTLRRPAASSNRPPAIRAS
ncbi:hypothetical protein ACVWZR_002065 [Bradyrhizobium sp. i1.3.1]